MTESHCWSLLVSAIGLGAAPQLVHAQTERRANTPASAYTQPSSQERVSPSSAEVTDQTGSAAEVSEIIVTGSRISRRDSNSNAQVIIVEQQILEKSGSVTIDTALKQLPQFTASTGSTTNSSGNQGQANVQLRGLGRQRTLVLLDGRRIVPSNSDGTVDLNSLPTELIENIEIVTGGASAAYGSDAVAGVVNVRLRHHVEGLEFTGQFGVAGHGDASDYKFGAAGGADFSDNRGSTVFSFEYAKRDSNFLVDRDFTTGSNRDSVLPQGLISFATGAPTQSALDSVFTQYGVAPRTVQSGNQFGFNADGTLFSTGLTVQNYKGSTSPSAMTVTPTQVLAEGRQYRFLQLPLETYTLFDRTSLDIGSTSHLYAQAFFSHDTGATQGNPLPAPSSATAGVPLVPVTNPFIPTDLRALLSSRIDPLAAFSFSKRFDAVGPRLQEETKDVVQIWAGIDGRILFRDWSYNVSGAYGENSIAILRTNYVSRAALQSLLSASDGGAALCPGGFNPFGSNSISPGCAAYISPSLHNKEEIKTYDTEVGLQGGLMTLPAGELRFAAGFDYRKDEFSALADPRIAAGDIIAGIGSTFVGSTDSKEIYGELLVPILENLPFAKQMVADLGFRYSDYSSVGSAETYKADLSWSVIAGVMLRGGYARAIRAPSVGELFSPIVQAPTIIGLSGELGSGDPCDIRSAYRKGANAAQVRMLCLAQGVPASIIDTYSFSQQSILNISGGNTKLDQETADTFSSGVVWRPSFSGSLFRTISASLDFYNIDVTNAVGSIPAALALSRCFNASGTTNPAYLSANRFCGLISRNGDGTINTVVAESLNLGGYKTSGFDLRVDWRFTSDALGCRDGGEVAMSFWANYLYSFKIQSLVGDPFLEYAGTIGNGQIDPVAISRPHWKSTFYLAYNLRAATVGLTWRYIGDMRNASNVGNTGTAVGVTSVSYFGLNARYRIKPKIELWATITNLLDKDPPVYPTAGSTDLATYDVLGRRFSIGLKTQF